MWEPEFLEHVIILIKYKRKIGDLLKMGVLDKFLSIMKLDDGDDEYDDDEEDEIQKIADDKYILLGSTDLDDIAEETGLPLSSEDYDSIAGHIINLLEHFPEVGEAAEDSYARYLVLEVDGNHIDKVEMTIKPQPEEEDPSDNDE